MRADPVCLVVSCVVRHSLCGVGAFSQACLSPSRRVRRSRCRARAVCSRRLVRAGQTWSQDRCGVCLTINLQRCITSYRGCHVNARRARGPVCTASVPVLDRAPICQRVSGPAAHPCVLTLTCPRVSAPLLLQLYVTCKNVRGYAHAFC